MLLFKAQTFFISVNLSFESEIYNYWHTFVSDTNEKVQKEARKANNRENWEMCSNKFSYRYNLLTQCVLKSWLYLYVWCRNLDDKNFVNAKQQQQTKIRDAFFVSSWKLDDMTETEKKELKFLSFYVSLMLMKHICL